jgi:hypothetical protein
MIRFTNNHPRKVNTMKDGFYINAVDGNAAIVSQLDEHISLGLHVRGGHVRIDLTPAQAQELINAITQTLNQETTA